MKPHHTRSKRPSLQQRKPSRGSIFEALEARIAPAAFTWINPASGAWATAANWSVVGVDADGIPDADDDVTINPATVGLVVTISTGTQTANTIAVPGIDVLAITGGTLTISAASTVSNLTLSGGTLNAGPQLTLTGTSAFSGNPTINGTVRNDDTLSIAGDPNLAGTLDNAGTMTNSGRFDFSGAGRLNNLAGATYEATTANASILSGTTTEGFYNAGTFRASPTGTATVSSLFHNLAGGTIDLTAGTLALHSNGTWTGANFLVSPGALVTLNAGSKTWEGTYTGTGGGIVRLGAGIQGASSGGN